MWIAVQHFNVYLFVQAAYDIDINMAFMYSAIDEFLTLD